MMLLMSKILYTKQNILNNVLFAIYLLSNIFLKVYKWMIYAILQKTNIYVLQILMKMNIEKYIQLKAMNLV